MLELVELEIGYEKNKTTLQNIYLKAEKGELIALLGANGCGKTALLKTVAGFLRPISGRVLIDGNDIFSFKKRERAEKISFLFQKNAVEWPFTVKELVAQGCFHKQAFLEKKNIKKIEKDVEEAIEGADLKAFAEKSVTELSGGEFQRVLIARAMAQKAGILLLDEPLNNLDPKFADSIMKLIKKLTVEQGITVLMSLHNVRLASLYADRIAVISQAKLTVFRAGELSSEDFFQFF
jgi:iron complex transport system ATP-binding protein